MWTVARAAIVAIIGGTVFTAALSSACFFHSSNVHQPIIFRRPSLLSSIQYRHDEFSELDKLKAKRLLIRQNHQKSHEELENVEEEVETDASIMVVGELEYLYDETEEARYSNDLYHIILMPTTFHKKHQDQMLTVENVADTCTEISGIEATKAYDLSLFVKHQGFSTLGTWTHTECLSIGKELLSRELDCRIVPFNGGSSNESYAFAIAAATAIVNDNDESYSDYNKQHGHCIDCCTCRIDKSYSFSDCIENVVLWN